MRLALGKTSQSIVSAALGLTAASAVAIALASAFREGDLFEALIPLLLAPSAMFVLYEGTAKRVVFAVVAVLIASCLLGAAEQLGLGGGGVAMVLISVAAVFIPLAVDLVTVDLGKQIRLDRRAINTSGVAFLVLVVPFCSWSLLSAHRTVVEEDTQLIGELAARISPEGDTLVVSHLDPKMRARAQRRVAIRSNGKTFELSDADVESVVEERTVRKQRRRRGSPTAETVSKEQEERMRLILNLQGTGIPEDVVVFSRRGPLTIFEAKVPLGTPSLPGS